MKNFFNVYENSITIVKIQCKYYKVTMRKSLKMYNAKTKGQEIGKNKLENKQKKQEVEYPTESCHIKSSLIPTPTSHWTQGSNLIPGKWNHGMKKANQLVCLRMWLEKNINKNQKPWAWNHRSHQRKTEQEMRQCDHDSLLLSTFHNPSWVPWCHWDWLLNLTFFRVFFLF